MLRDDLRDMTDDLRAEFPGMKFGGAVRRGNLYVEYKATLEVDDAIRETGWHPSYEQAIEAMRGIIAILRAKA